MAIARAAIDSYLNRKLDNKSWFKTLLPLEVEEDLSRIKPAHKFTIPTFRLDQKICFLLGIAYPETVYLTDLGLGKTGISLELLSYFYHNKFIRRAFVFCPTDELVEGWEDEIKKWGFTIPYLLFRKGSSEEKWNLFSEFGDGLIIGTYTGIAAMVSELQEKKKKKNAPENTPTKRERVPQTHLLDKLADRCDAVFYDQSTKVGNKGSLSYEVCNEFSERAQIRFALAGRAFGRDPGMLWTQFNLVDRGAAFGTYSLFREAFYRKEFHNYGIKWVQRKRREKQLARFITTSSIRYAASECVDLPPKVPVIRKCTFPDENWEYYDRVAEEILQQRGNYREVKNSFLRMRQIASGFVGFIDDDTGDRAQIEFETNPKLDLLMNWIDEVPEDRKVLIIHEFNWSGARICQELAKAKYQHGWLYGGTKDWTSIKRAYNEDPDYRFIVANWKKGAMGLNLQAGSYIFFYESPVSVIERAESEGRVYRVGQKHKTFICDPIVRDSIEERILEFHQEGKDLYKRLVDNPASLIKRRV